jgi:hypothetical protein
MILAETASLTRDTEWLARRLADKPEILAAVNRSRARQGMCPVVPPARSGPAAPAAARGVVRDTVADCVWIIAAYGRADRVINRSLPEEISYKAFGSADDLNVNRGWCLRNDHTGPMLEAAGDRLRAFDSLCGLALLWLPDPTRRDHLQALEAIEAGRNSVSVQFTHAKRSAWTHGGKTVETVWRASLDHVALLLDGSKGSYRGACAMVCRRAGFTPEARAQQLQNAMSLARLREYSR